jgi:general secretion pathway protein E
MSESGRGRPNGIVQAVPSISRGAIDKLIGHKAEGTSETQTGQPIARKSSASAALGNALAAVPVKRTESHHVGVPLTSIGGKFELTAALQEILCYMDDGRLLVSKSHVSSPSVRAFIARLDRLGKEYELLPVDISVIAAVYAGARSFSKEATSSDMQNYAVEMFRRATKFRASDIHIRVSSRTNTQVLFRIHSDLAFQEEQTCDFGHQLCTTIYQSMADVADATFETLSQQDARISDRNKLPEHVDGIRVATSPQVDGHVMVLRLLYNDTESSLDPTSLGYTPDQAHNFTLMKKRPTGINIIGGPTGSGKSTTMQRLLASIIKETKGRKNIITVEDPPEYPISGAVQTPVTNADSEEERSKAFQSSIKAAMRLDPDVIMIGEVRDTPSARLAVQAAMTGHQVWTTLHANGALRMLDRLIDLGVPMELASDPAIVTGLTCQRLLKVLCPHCKTPLGKSSTRYAQEEVDRMCKLVAGDRAFVHGPGCERCEGSGIKGRTVVAETIVTDERLMSFVRVHDRVGAIRYWRTELHGLSMIGHAKVKVEAGEIDPFQAEEVVGLFNDDEQ